ncbi:MAG: exodeoxyribonuclease VII large subunit [Firmicutes bacterium]|nr:exodeoxyribonuclease VII large subunit [Candidatus Fiminaster equi]
MMEKDLFSVSSLNRYIKQLFDRDFTLKGLRLKGEISNFKRYPSGHIYFTLKDEESSIKAVMFYEYTKFIPNTIKDGDEVIITGYVSVYPARGEYQVYAQAMELFGEGAQLLELELLKKKLAAEGLFDASRKRKINIFPKAIGVISAPGSAALADIKTNLLRRNPLIEVKIFPSLVQGADAPKELLKALKKAKEEQIDTLIIGRGGGASEDLSAFNDETLVREAANFPVPIISAVGHEIDFTLIDYVADARASTPTGAAELATIDKREIYELLANKRVELDEIITDKIGNYRHKLDLLKMNSFFENPKVMYENTLVEVENTKKRLDAFIAHLVEMKAEKIHSLSKQLHSISVDATLQRGFAIMENEQGKIVKDIKDVEVNQMVKTRLKGGVVSAKVISKEVK